MNAFVTGLRLRRLADAAVVAAAEVDTIGSTLGGSCCIRNPDVFASKYWAFVAPQKASRTRHALTGMPSSNTDGTVGNRAFHTASTIEAVDTPQLSHDNVVTTREGVVQFCHR